MTNSRLLLMITTLMALAACTRPGSENSASVSFSLPATQPSRSLKTSLKGQEVALEEQLVHASVKVSQGGTLVKNGEVNWNLCRKEDNGCDPSTTGPSLEFEIDTGKDTLFQVLAVYRVDQQMTFYYGDVNQSVSASGSIAVNLSALNSSVIVGNASGRYLTGADSGPTGMVDIMYEPPGKLPLRIESDAILNGWFDVLMMWGLPLKYVVHDMKNGDMVLWNKTMALDSDEMNPYSGDAAKRNRLMRIFYPIGVRIESGGTQAPSMEEARVHAWGYWADPNASDAVSAAQSKAICQVGLTTSSFTRLHKWAPVTEMSSAAPQTLAVYGSQTPLPPVSDFMSTTAGLPIIAQGGNTLVSGYCGASQDVDTNRYVNFQRVTISQVDASQDEAAGFRGFLRTDSAASGNRPLVVTGTTTKTISGRALPGLENLFTKIKLYKNTTDPNARLKHVDCLKLVNGTSSERGNFVDGSMTDASVASDGTMAVTSNITAAEASAGVSAAVCGILGTTPFPVGIFLESGMFQQFGSGATQATSLKIIAPQGEAATSATIANNTCTPIVIEGRDGNNVAQIPAGNLNLTAVGFNSYLTPTCGTAATVSTIFGGNRQMIWVQRSGSGSLSGTSFTVTSANSSISGSLPFDFKDATDTSKILKILAPQMVNAYECLPIMYQSWNGGADNMMINLGSPSYHYFQPSGSNWLFYSDMECQSPHTGNVTLMSLPSAIIYGRYMGSSTTSASLSTTTPNCMTAPCAAAPVLNGISVQSPGAFSQFEIEPMERFSGRCEKIKLRFADVQHRHLPAPSSILTLSGDVNTVFYDDSSCTTGHEVSTMTVPADSMLFTAFVKHNGVETVPVGLSLGNVAASPAVEFKAPSFDEIVIQVAGESYDPATGVLTGSPSTLHYNATIAINIFLRQGGVKFPYNGTLSVTVVRNSLTYALNLTFIDGASGVGVGTGSTTEMAYLTATAVSPSNGPVTSVQKSVSIIP